MRDGHQLALAGRAREPVRPRQADLIPLEQRFRALKKLRHFAAVSPQTTFDEARISERHSGQSRRMMTTGSRCVCNPIRRARSMRQPGLPASMRRLVPCA